MAALSGLFYGSNKMATDVDVQFFSHLNGLTLGNNWGDLIRLFDTCLVTGKDLPDITAASIDEQGDVHLTFYTAHQAMLLQIIELSGFTPSELNQKYRIKGVPDATQLILKPALDITERSITTIGTGKLASLGYDIIFRDTGDVKRVYRAKNPTAQHPFIRVDESLASVILSVFQHASGTTVRNLKPLSVTHLWLILVCIIHRLHWHLMRTWVNLRSMPKVSLPS